MINAVPKYGVKIGIYIRSGMGIIRHKTRPTTTSNRGQASQPLPRRGVRAAEPPRPRAKVFPLIDFAGLASRRFGNHVELHPLDGQAVRDLAPAANGDGFASGNGKHSFKIVILGGPIGGRQAKSYRGLVRELCARGHRILVLEREPLRGALIFEGPRPPYGRTVLYSTVNQLKDRFTPAVRNADLVAVDSYVSEGPHVCQWVTHIAQGATAFYDLEAPATIRKLKSGDPDYLSADLIARFSMYLSTTGGPLLPFLEGRYSLPMARPLYHSVDTNLCFPEAGPIKWHLGYAGTYS